MEVTRTNFKESLKQIQVAIDECDFLAIDGEFTGLNHAGHTHTATFDTPEERYYKLVQGSTNFLLIQFGLCAFSYDKERKIYSAKPFNCYIFQRQFSQAGPDLRFSCQSSSLDFLMGQRFDFNKWVREGVSFLRPADEARIREQLERKHEMFSSPAVAPPGTTSEGRTGKGPVQIPPEQKDFIDDIVKKVEKFLETGEEDSLCLTKLNAFQRKLLYQTLQTKFGSEMHMQTKTGDNKERYIVVTKVSGEEDMKKLEQSKHAQDLAEIHDAIGFTHVIKMISKSGKLVVGHNMLLDVCHTVNQFMYPLPQDYEEFKAMCRCIFPRLIDTKLMANTQPFKDRIINSGLGSLLLTTQMPPFKKPTVEIVEEFSKQYEDSESQHEAGYDAFITGQAFIALANFLGVCQKADCEHTPPSSPLLLPFINKIFMMRSQDIPYMDLAAKDLTPARDHVFHLTFPHDWKSSDISHLFAQFGNVYISWLDDTSAYVALNCRAVAPSVMKTLVQKDAAYRIMTYHDHKHQFKWTPDKSSCKPAGNQPMGQTTQHSGNASQTTPVHHSNKLEEQRGSKRTHTCDDNKEGAIGAKKIKSLNVDAPEFQSRITPTSTPEKEETLSWPDNINTSNKKITILKQPLHWTNKNNANRGRYMSHDSNNNRYDYYNRNYYNNKMNNKNNNRYRNNKGTGSRGGSSKCGSRGNTARKIMEQTINKDKKMEGFIVKDEEFPPLS